ncbi:MAG: peptidase M64, partial [Holophaga sp.]|nr:peptidase M64 [Holophaga sp.]
MLRTLSALFLASALAAQAPRTLRVDYYHTGTAATETFTQDRTVLEPLPWPGDLSKALDTSNLGKYFFEVVDRATNRVLFSRGFNSIYGEWETTGEARTTPRTFSESLRFPRPAGPVQINVKKRDARNAFREIWSFSLDPADIFVDSAPPPSPGALITIQQSGAPAEKVDLLILGDGYTREELPRFEQQARRLTEALFARSPF